jgi:LysM repeat protein
VATHGEAVRAIEAVRRKAAREAPEEVKLQPEVTIERVARPPLPAVSVGEAQKALEKGVVVLAPAWVIFSNGRFVVALRTKLEAQRCLDRLQKSYGPGEPSLKEQVEIESGWVPAKRRLPVKEAVARLRSAGQPLRRIVNEGETAESIASAHGTTVETLRELNPQTDLGGLRAGTELSLPARPPLLTIVTRRKVEEIEPIPFGTETVFQPNLGPGQNPVLVEGKPGSKKVVYLVTLENGVEKSRKVMSSIVIEPPVARQVAVNPRLHR